MAKCSNSKLTILLSDHFHLLLSFVHTNESPRWHNLIHLCLLSFCPTAPGKWKNLTGSPLAFLTQQDGDFSDNLRAKHPENTLSDTSLYAELCRNASCNILRLSFNGSEMTTCLINFQINDKRKMSILSEDTLLESGKLFKKNFQSRSLDTCAASSTRCPNFRGLFTSKITWYYTWNLKPKRWII